MRGGRHPPVVALPAAVRPCRSRRHPAGASGRRGLRDRDLRRRELRLFRVPDAARGKARLRSRLRARPPLRALRRDTGGVPATGHRSGRGAEAARSRALRRARALVVPSSYLASIAAGWGLDQRLVSVLPNPAPDLGIAPAPQEPGTFVFVGRLTRQKDLGVAISAIGRVPEARLIVIGDGPDRPRLEGSGRRIRGSRPDRLPRVASSIGGAGDRRRLGGGVADERLGELPSLGCRGPLGRRAGSLDGRGWRP